MSSKQPKATTDQALLEHFLASSERNAWIAFGEVQAYLRKSVRYMHGEFVDVFDLANINVLGARGRGAFSRWHAEVERVLQGRQYKYLLIESAHNPIMASFALRHGYQLVPQEGHKSYLKSL